MNVDDGLDPVDEWVAESFPASDPPSWWSGTPQRDVEVKIGERIVP